MLPLKIEEKLILTIDEALREHSLGILRFLELEAQRRNWTCSYRQRRSEYAHWIDPGHRRSFDVRSLPNVLRIVGHARWLDTLLVLEQRIQHDSRSSRCVEGAQHGCRARALSRQGAP